MKEETIKIERYLDSFGKYVVKQSRTNLTKAKKNVNKKLYDSIKFKVLTTRLGFTIEFYMESYGTFVDKGVSGNKKKQSYKDYRGKVVKSPYSYKSKGPPIDILSKWIKKRGLKGRVDKKWKSAGNRGGQYISTKSFAYIISNSIKIKGIKSLSFFQRPLELGLKKFSKELLKNVKEDVMNNLSKNLNK